MTTSGRLGVLAAAVALLAAAMIAIALQPAEAGGFNERVSGNFIDTAIDTNDDGLQANSWSGQANGNGSPSYEGLVEIQFEPTGLCDMDAGEMEGSLVLYSIVRRYANGDLMFSESSDGSLCFNPGTGLASLTINAVVTGGTGNHANAVGDTYTATYTVRGLVQQPGQAILHGAFYGATSG